MYHCHIQFYLIGYSDRVFEIVKEMSPLEQFVHTFFESAKVEKELLEKADVILVNLRDMDAKKALQELVLGKKKTAELILLAPWEQISCLEELSEVRDIWNLPMSEKETEFRFLRWQQAYKKGIDCWETNQFLNVCLDDSPNLIWFKDKNGIHKKVNKSFCELVGKTKEQAQGQGHAYIWNVEQDDPACTESEQEVMEKRITCVSEEIVQKGDKEARVLTTYKSPLYDLDGSVMGTVGIGVDITQEREYEQEIVEKEHLLDVLFSTMDCGVIYHSVDGKRVVNVNKAALRLLGYESQEELMKDGFTMVAQSVLDEDKPEVRKSIETLKEVGNSITITYRVRHKDGKLYYILGNAKLVEIEGERFYQRFLVDVTAQKLQEKEEWEKKDMELQYQEQVFDVFSNFLSYNVDDVYIMLDETLEKLEFVSPNVERVLGVTAEYIGQFLKTGERDHSVVGVRVSREEILALQPGMSLDTIENERLNPKTDEGKWFRESIYCTSVQGKKKIIVYLSDRTKEKTVQNTLSEALEMAQVASKAKSNFLSSVSHDIRTPMNAIMGFTTLLREEADNPEIVLEYTQKITDAGQHLLGLINDVLDINKIESGNTVLNIVEMNLAEVIENIKNIVLPQAKRKNQIFEISAYSLVDECLFGDRLRIEQILINILSNAVKYTPEGGRVEMQVTELPKVDAKHSNFRFVISDNGAGMSEEYQEVLFEPFTREQSKAYYHIQGTGLGMAITKSLVDLMGGSIKVESKLGVGTTFTVELSLRAQKQVDHGDFWKDHAIKRMIVADNDEDICHDIIKKMEGTGVEVHYVTSGVEAIETIRQARKHGQPYDLILLDWKMPDLNGLETARLIRKKYQDKIPILLFSAYDWVEIELEAMELGINHFLPKPFFMSNFKDSIQKMIGHGGKKESKSMKEDALVKGKRILVVDDIDVNRLILVKILSALGAVCDIAKDGQEAVEKFESTTEEDTYDIIMMDVQMPNMNGYEATEAIRDSEHPAAKQVAIIAMTANAFMDDIREALASGMDAHVAKPIVLEQMKATIQEVMSRKSSCPYPNKLTQ